jgi:chemotaxis protein CheX
MAQDQPTGVAPTQAELAGFITTASTDVFSMMLGVDMVSTESFVQTTATAPAAGVVSLVGLAGDWIGTGSISCSSAMACRLSSLMLMAEYSSINEEVLDAIAELTNMIIGNVKTSLEERLGPMGLSVPTVIFGKNFQTRNASSHEWVVVPFRYEGECLHVQLCLQPGRDPSQSTTRHGFPMPHVLTL